MKRNLFKISLLLIAVTLFGCTGTINTVNYLPRSHNLYKNAYIVSAENSKFIEFKFGIVTPFVYYVPPDDPAVDHEIIGNTDLVIKQELEKYGISVVIGKRGDLPKDFDLIVEYNDTWRWDFKEIIDKLEIAFISPSGDSLIAKSTYNISKNKELHNFPTPEKIVPKMIKELLEE